MPALMNVPALPLIRMSLEMENTIDSHGDLRPLAGMPTTYLAVNQSKPGYAIRYHAELAGSIAAAFTSPARAR
jgi:hypothetical protein